MGNSQELYVFIPYRCKVEPPDGLQHEIVKRILHMEERSFVTSTRKLLPYKMEITLH